MRLSKHFIGCTALAVAFLLPAIFQSCVDRDHPANFVFMPRVGKQMFPHQPTELQLEPEIQVEAGKTVEILPLFNGGNEEYDQAYTLSNPYTNHEFYLDINYDNVLRIEGCIPGNYSISVTSIANPSLSKPLFITVSGATPESVSFSTATQGDLVVGSKGKFHTLFTPYYASIPTFFSTQNSSVIRINDDEYEVLSAGTALIHCFTLTGLSATLKFNCVEPTSTTTAPSIVFPGSLTSGDIKEAKVDFHGRPSSKGHFAIVEGHENALLIGNRVIAKRDGSFTLVYLDESGNEIARTSRTIRSPYYSHLAVYLTAYLEKRVIHYYDLTANIPTSALTKMRSAFRGNFDDPLHHPTIEYVSLDPEIATVDQYGAVRLCQESTKTFRLTGLRHERNEITSSDRSVLPYLYWGENFGTHHLGTEFAFFLVFAILPGFGGAWISFAALDGLVNKTVRKKRELLLTALLVAPSILVWVLTCSLALRSFDLGLLATIYLSMAIGFWTANALRKRGKHKYRLERTELSI